ncbi:type II toxin-antitoxin system PemK/MazF family toxin, partial [Serratia marcescens]|nr:type II toxin-antitoxin system PemK/MazF family toxin [Serratia marcescens]
YNYRIPNEMIKKRPVVVIGKHKGQYIVVPISSTKETDKKPAKNPENVGFHIMLQPGDMPVTAKYEQGKARWAKSNLLVTIDGSRLTDIYDIGTGQFVVAHKISDDTLLKIRQGVIISIGLRSILIQQAVEEPVE